MTEDFRIANYVCDVCEQSFRWVNTAQMHGLRKQPEMANSKRLDLLQRWCEMRRVALPRQLDRVVGQRDGRDINE